jgi:hypothetical protein
MAGGSTCEDKQVQSEVAASKTLIVTSTAHVLASHKMRPRIIVQFTLNRITHYSNMH